MAKKKHHARKRKHSAAPAKRHHKRRRMSAGGKFKALSNPILGGIIGGAAGIILKNIVNKAVSNPVIGTAAPLVAGFLIRKKMPMVAAGMIAVPALSYLGTKVPMLAEGGNTNFADNLLLSDNLYLSGNDFTLNEMEEMEEGDSFSEYSMDEE